jgi:hypothetical protein
MSEPTSGREAGFDDVRQRITRTISAPAPTRVGMHAMNPYHAVSYTTPPSPASGPRPKGPYDVGGLRGLRRYSQRVPVLVPPSREVHTETTADVRVDTFFTPPIEYTHSALSPAYLTDGVWLASDSAVKMRGFIVHQQSHVTSSTLTSTAPPPPDASTFYSGAGSRHFQSEAFAIPLSPAAEGTDPSRSSAFVRR